LLLNFDYFKFQREKKEKRTMRNFWLF